MAQRLVVEAAAVLGPPSPFAVACDFAVKALAELLERHGLQVDLAVEDKGRNSVGARTGMAVLGMPAVLKHSKEHVLQPEAGVQVRMPFVQPLPHALQNAQALALEAVALGLAQAVAHVAATTGKVEHLEGLGEDLVHEGALVEDAAAMRRRIEQVHGAGVPAGKQLQEPVLQRPEVDVHVAGAVVYLLHLFIDVKNVDIHGKVSMNLIIMNIVLNVEISYIMIKGEIF